MEKEYKGNIPATHAAAPFATPLQRREEKRSREGAEKQRR
jgi:hypothetical protein